jgi:hypothetical protein
VLLHAAPTRVRVLVASLVALLTVGTLLPSASAAGRSTTTTSRVTAVAPKVTLTGTTAAFSYSVTTTTRTTLKALRLRVRPAGGGDVGKDTGAVSNLTVSGTRTLTATQSGLTGTWTAAVAWTTDGVVWSTGPATTFTTATTAAAPRRSYGTLQSSPTRLATNNAAGIDLATYDVSWKRFEPVEGQVDAVYLNELRTTFEKYRAAGVRVVLNTGVHHPPAWLFGYPNSRYVNQYGDVYASVETGKKIANMVFNQQMRDKQAAYLSRLFAALGTDFYGVRLGGGWYGELNYPEPTFNGRTNAYWGFDALARGTAAGRVPSIPANPVPSWLPGAPSVDHTSARRFADWYMASLDDYHDWQISTVRRLYSGKLLMMYPSWGIRPGQLDAAVTADLAGTTSAEINGEVQRGFDVARFIGGITDPGVVVYTTWLNADASADAGTDARWWSPVKYLASLARNRAVPLEISGENTGRDTVEDVRVTFEQARRYGLGAVVWAFEPELYGGVYATIDDLGAAIRADKAL